MATYVVTDPQTGRRLRLTGDAPPTEQELEQIFSAGGGQQQPAAGQQAPTARPQDFAGLPGSEGAAPAAAANQPAAPERGALEAAGRYAGVANRGIIEAVAGLPALAADVAAYPVNRVVEAAGGPEQLIPSYSDSLSRGLDTVFPQPATAGERMVAATAGGIGGAATGIGVGQQLAQAARPVTAAVGRTLAANPAAQLASGASAGAGGQVARESGADETGQLLATIAGGAAGAAPFALRNVRPSLETGMAGASASDLEQVARVYGARSPEYASMVAQLDAAGVPLTTGQRTGTNWLKAAERTGSEIPFTGVPLQRQFEQQQRTYQRELLRRVGLDDGSDMITRENIDRARDNLSRGYTRALEGKRISIADDDFLNDLAAIEARHSQFIDDPSKNRVRSIINGFLEEAARGGEVSGQWYQQQRSLFGRRARGTGETAPLFADLKTALDDAFARAAGGAKGELDSQWARLKQLETIYNRSGGAAASEGLMSPAAIAREAAGSPGGRDWQDFTRAGAAVLPDRIGNSGTAQRNLLIGLMGGAVPAAAIEPTSMLTLLATGAAGRGAASALARGMTPPSPTEYGNRLLRLAAPATAAAAAQN